MRGANLGHWLTKRDFKRLELAIDEKALKQYPYL